MGTIYTAVLFPLLLLIGQTLVALGQRKAWLFEFALPTMGDPYWRRNINGGGWTSWWTITSQ